MILDGKKVIDVSWPITPTMATYKNKAETKPVITTYATHKTGSHFQSEIKLDMHCGTHLDRPLHMFKDGADMDSYDLRRMIRTVKIFDLSKNSGDLISLEDVKTRNIVAGDFIIFKTINSFKDEYMPDYTALSPEASEYLAAICIDGIGVDGFSIGRGDFQHKSHDPLLSKDIVVLEGLRLKEVDEGEFILIALPLKIEGVEGSPVRAVLLGE